MRGRNYTLILSLLFLVSCSSGGGGGGSGNNNNDNNTPDPDPVDLEAPDTSITSTPPSLTNLTDAEFSFQSTEDNSTFEVSLDDGDYVAAASPYTLTGVTDGAHTLKVRAIDSSDNTDETPAAYSWEVDTTPPVASILFPAPNALTDAATITIRGSASDQNEVTSVTVNGTPATTNDNFQNWQVSMPVNNGLNTFVVTATDELGNSRSEADITNVHSDGAVINSSYSVAATADASELYVYDNEQNSIVKIDTATQAKTLLSGNGAGSGIAFGILSDIYLDSANNRLIAVDWNSDRVLSIDIDNGSRSILSDVSAGSTSFFITSGITYDSGDNKVYVVERGNNSIITVDLSNGSRSLLSGGGAGTGIAFSNPLDVVVDKVTDTNNPRLLVSDSAVNAVMAVDLATGNRSILSAMAPNGTGTALTSPLEMTLDTANNRVLVVDGSTNTQLIAVDLATGNRTNITDLSTWNVWPSGYVIEPGNSTVTIVTRDGNLVVSKNFNTQQVATLLDTRFGTGPEFNNVRGMDFDTLTNKLMVTDPIEQAIFEFDIESGVRSVISGAARGTGPALSSPVNCIVDRETDPANPRLLVLDSGLDALFSIDMTTGDRTVISSPSIGTGTVLNTPRDLVLDDANNRVLVIDSYVSSGALIGVLFEIDLTTGNRTVISSNQVGSGINFVLTSTLTLDKVSNPGTPRVLVGDGQTFGIVEVDLDTGDRTMFSSSSSNVGSGIFMSLPTESAIDEANNRLLVIDFSAKRLLFVDLLTAHRSAVSDNSSPAGAGPTLDAMNMAADFGNQLAYTSGANPKALMQVDLVTGSRVIVNQ